MVPAPHEQHLACDLRAALKVGQDEDGPVRFYIVDPDQRTRTDASCCRLVHEFDPVSLAKAAARVASEAAQFQATAIESSRHGQHHRAILARPFPAGVPGLAADVDLDAVELVLGAG